MWIRKCYLDDSSEVPSPIPTRVCSNGEFIPPPQSEKQREFESRLRDLADRNARRLGLSRREFLQTSCGMAAAMLCFNSVFGKTYEVEAVEALEAAAYKERWPKKEFIFDNQTHHVNLSSHWYETDAGRAIGAFLLRWRADALEAIHPSGKPEPVSATTLEAFNKASFVKELFLDSDTVMAVISGVPTANWEDNLLPPDQMARTRDDVNGAARSQRMISHGIVRPELGAAELEQMQRQAEVLKISSWKMYPAAESGRGFWWLDDPKVAYPFWEKTLKLGIRNVCVHKGLPLGIFNEEHCHPRDVAKAAKDFPQLNFIIYHSAYHPTAKVEPGKTDPKYIPWTSELIESVNANDLKNVYFELGATWNVTSSAYPEVAMHMFGQLLNLPAGEDRIIWGTDSILFGGPRSQIERFRRFQIRDDIAKKYGYRKLTPEIKAKVFGLNAARLYGIDVKASRNAIKADKIAELREDYRQSPRPSNVEYGWVWQGGRTRG